MIRFTIAYPPTRKGKAAWNKRFGLNAYYAGKHWAKRKKDAEELHAITISAMIRAGIKRKVFKRPVNIKILFDDRLDCSNHAVLVKCIEDAMKGWVIEDDDRRYVRSITTGFNENGCIEVYVNEVK